MGRQARLAARRAFSVLSVVPGAHSFAAPPGHVRSPTGRTLTLSPLPRGLSPSGPVAGGAASSPESLSSCDAVLGARVPPDVTGRKFVGHIVVVLSLLKWPPAITSSTTPGYHRWPHNASTASPAPNAGAQMARRGFLLRQLGQATTFPVWSESLAQRLARGRLRRPGCPQAPVCRCPRLPPESMPRTSAGPRLSGWRLYRAHEPRSVAVRRGTHTHHPRYQYECGRAESVQSGRGVCLKKRSPADDPRRDRERELVRAPRLPGPTPSLRALPPGRRPGRRHRDCRRHGRRRRRRRRPPFPP